MLNSLIICLIHRDDSNFLREALIYAKHAINILKNLIHEVEFFQNDHISTTWMQIKKIARNFL